MPLYELVCIAQRFKTSATLLPLQALLKETSTFVHESGGCVRRLDYHGLQGIPQKTRKDGQWHDQGDLWTMWFDTNPKTLDNLHTRLRTDPRVLRYTTIKKGVTLPEVTAALPTPRTSLDLSQSPSDNTTSIISSLYSSNSSFSNTMQYTNPNMNKDEVLAAKEVTGKTSRADYEKLEQHEKEEQEERASSA